MTVKTVVNGGDRTNGARIERTIRMGRLSSAALFNRAATGSSSATAAVAVAAYADGFVVPPAVAGRSSFSVRLARTCSLVANATISLTGVCKSMISAWMAGEGSRLVTHGSDGIQ